MASENARRFRAPKAYFRWCLLRSTTPLGSDVERKVEHEEAAQDAFTHCDSPRSQDMGAADAPAHAVLAENGVGCSTHCDSTRSQDAGAAGDPADAVLAELRCVTASFPGVVEPEPWRIVHVADSAKCHQLLKDVCHRAPRYGEDTDAEPALKPLKPPRKRHPRATTPCSDETKADEAKTTTDTTKPDTRLPPIASLSRFQRFRVGVEVPMFQTLVVVEDDCPEDVLASLRSLACAHVMQLGVQRRVEAEVAAMMGTTEEEEEEEEEEEANVEVDEGGGDADEFMAWVVAQAQEAAAEERAAARRHALLTVARAAGKGLRAFLKDEARMRRQEWIAWARVAGGRVAIFRRPGAEEVEHAARQGATAVVTLVWDERAASVRQAAARAGIQWLWCPLGANSNDLKGMQSDPAVWQLYLRRVAQAAHEVRRGGSVLIHCTAGLNRSGMFAYSLLRTLDLPHADAFNAITAARPVTNRNIGKVRYQVGRAVLQHWRATGDAAAAVAAAAAKDDDEDALLVARAVDLATALDRKGRKPMRADPRRPHATRATAP